MSPPRVLVVLVTYKSNLAWLREALHSIASQSFKNFECVVADSTNPLPAPSPAWELWSAEFSSDKRFLFNQFWHQPTADVAHKVNAVTEQYSDYDYCALVADDDYLNPFFLERQIAKLESHPSLGFAQGYVWLFGDRNGLWTPGVKKNADGDSLTGICTVQDQLMQNQFAGTCVMRMKPFLEFGGYDKDVCPEGFPCGFEDTKLFVQFLKAGWQSDTIPEPLLFSRQRPECNNRKLYGSEHHMPMMKKLMDKCGISYEVKGEELVVTGWEQVRRG
jgi:glycosyltransferase involved in cell wall biosynthesis